ncbi:hypothetical protein PtB15_4B632 [Puccinia triticina]|nr:hypothetical protein PtB15_4B632 [Puccinia triticina]
MLTSAKPPTKVLIFGEKHACEGNVVGLGADWVPILEAIPSTVTKTTFCGPLLSRRGVLFSGVGMIFKNEVIEPVAGSGNKALRLTGFDHNQVYVNYIITPEKFGVSHLPWFEFGDCVDLCGRLQGIDEKSGLMIVEDN